MGNRYDFSWAALILAAGAVGLCAGRGPAASAAPTGAPSQQKEKGAAASAEEIKGLIDQLGADEYAAREAAAKRLRAIGKAALPALTEATKNDDAEIASRAQALVKRMSVRPLPAPMPGGVNGLIQNTRMQIRGGDAGERVITVNEGGREVEIKDGPDGITMTVRGLVDGKPGSEEYVAGSAEQLREDNPEAFEIYQRWAGAVGPDIIFNGGGRVIVNGGLLLPPVPDEIDMLRSRLDKQMRDGKLKEAERDEVNKAMEKLAAARLDLVAGMEKYTAQCDELRKTLEQYKLDPGDLLPPPAKTRLGVSINSDSGRLFIQKVADHSRAQRIGLQAGDIIRKVDGQDVENVGDLRRLVSAKESGLVVEITRAGEDVKLEEKAPAATKPAK
jgi:hypothetical protein